MNHQDWNIFPGIRYGAVALFSGQLSNQRARIWPNVPGILISPDRIHPVLLEYAKHDPDATVRQWAVEGMRYLGKNEALDDLFESFTEDPSNNVRERAGCNLSDCGNFTRLERMRMVPKFLDVVADSSTNAQMKNWSYLALREITDANVPSDPQAWRKWYREHGPEKLGEFERLDWWKVRGDE